MKTILLTLPTLIGLSSTLHAEVPSTLNYQGRVLQNGQPFDGTGHFVFGIYEGSTLLWTNKLPVPSPLNDPAAAIDSSDSKSLTVRDGVFNVRLGEGDADNAPVGTDVFFKFDAVQRVRTDVKLKVWFSPVAEGPYTKLDPDITFASVPFAQVAAIAQAVSADIGVPVGAVVAWWGAITSLPPGFELCDGNPPSSQDAIFSGNKPNLVGKFLRGAEISRTDVASIPFIGGNDNVAARTTGGTAISLAQMPSHSHAHTLGTASAGSHSHSTSGNSASDDGGGSDSHFALGDSDAGRSWPGITINSAGAHTHTITGSITNAGSGAAHDHSIPAHDNRPAYLELFYIIRVK